MMRKPILFITAIMIFDVLSLMVGWSLNAEKNQSIKESIFIPNPKPTHVEKEFIPLEKIKEIDEDIDEENFFAKPRALTVDDEGNLYVFDALLTKIFKFDKTFKFIKSFGSAGRGPGEISKSMGYNKIHFSGNGCLNVCDTDNLKILVYDKNGALKNELRMPHTHTLMSRGNSLPVVDSESNYYLLAKYGGGISKYDSKGRLLHTYLTAQNYDRFVVYRPKPVGPKMSKMINMWIRPSAMNTSYDILPDNRLFIYLANGSTAFIFKNNKLEHQYDIWPKDAIESYRQDIERVNKPSGKSKKKRNEYYSPMFQRAFLDQDDGKHFYLDGGSYKNDMKCLYKFSISGDLVGVLVTKDGCFFHAKRHHQFYGIRRGKIKIFKENKK